MRVIKPWKRILDLIRLLNIEAYGEVWRPDEFLRRMDAFPNPQSMWPDTIASRPAQYTRAAWNSPPTPALVREAGGAALRSETERAAGSCRQRGCAHAKMPCGAGASDSGTLEMLSSVCPPELLQGLGLCRGFGEATRDQRSAPRRSRARQGSPRPASPAPTAPPELGDAACRGRTGAEPGTTSLQMPGCRKPEPANRSATMESPIPAQPWGVGEPQQTQTIRGHLHPPGP